MLRVYPLVVAILVSLLFAGTPVLADEVELHSGAVFRGTIEKENDAEVVIRTGLGAMTFPKADVKEIRRSDRPAPGEAEPAPEARSFSIEGISPSVRPVVLGDAVFAVEKDGHLAAWSIATSKRRWMSDVGKGGITGIAADPGGVYLLTREGQAARLNLSTGDLVWLAKPGGAFEGAPLLFRRRVFGFQTGRGLVSFESGNGSVRGRTELVVGRDTPLAATGAAILLGTVDGLLVRVENDGTEITGAVRTGYSWNGRDLAVSLRTVVVASRTGHLLSRAASERGKSRSVPVAGLAGHPFAADATRAYVELDGALTALNLVNGRVAWRSYGVPRVLAMAIEGTTIFVTTSDDTIAALSLRDGKILWSAALGGRPASPPLPSGRSALVLLEDGRAILFSGAPKEPAETDPLRASPGATSEIHSPDGYRVRAPKGWAVSEGVTRGRVSLGFRPRSKASRFDREGATERDRSLLEVSAYLSVAVLPASKIPLEDRVKVYLHDEKLAADNGNHRLGKTETGAERLGGREWTRIRIQHIIGSDMLKGAFEKTALTTTLPDGRIVWIEGKVPELYGKAGAEDVIALAESLEPEKAEDFTPPADVAVAEAAVAALDRGDMKAFALHLSEPLRARVAGETVKVDEIRFRLLTRSSAPRGSRRTVRVRIDRKAGTSYTGLTLAKEQGRWVVIDLGAL
ncbi:MAG: PQQ-binding-like beta-propeller repeat protein [Planctomycetota bacterium]